MRSPFASKPADSNMPIRLLLFGLILLSSPLTAEAVPQDAPQADVPGSYEYQDPVVVQRTVEDVMARPEFLRLHRKDEGDDTNTAWLDPFLDWLERVFTRGDERSARDGSFGAGFIYLVAFVIVVAALAFIVKSVLDASKEQELDEEPGRARIARGGAAPGETPPEEYWARAQALAAAGDEKLALRELLLGAMSTLERQGFIRHRRGLTNRDYFWAATGNARESIRTLITAFEKVYFGRREASAASFHECARAYRASFHDELGMDSASASMEPPE